MKLKDKFENEQYDFTPWVVSNILNIGKAIGQEGLSVKAVEYNINGKRLDILAVNKNGELVAIENQYGKTDFSHADRLVSFYAANVNAKYAYHFAESANNNLITEFTTQAFYRGITYQYIPVTASRKSVTVNGFEIPSDHIVTTKKRDKVTRGFNKLESLIGPTSELKDVYLAYGYIMPFIFKTLGGQICINKHYNKRMTKELNKIVTAATSMNLSVTQFNTYMSILHKKLGLKVLPATFKKALPQHRSVFKTKLTGVSYTERKKRVMKMTPHEYYRKNMIAMYGSWEAYEAKMAA